MLSVRFLFANPDVESTYAVAGTVCTDCSCSYSAASAAKCVTNSCSWRSSGRFVQGQVANSGTAGCCVAWSVGREEGSHSSGDFPAHSEPASLWSGPASVPGLPVAEGEFPIQQTPRPEPTPEPPVPETAEDTDSDATVDYREREDSLLALAHGDDDVLIRLPSGFDLPSFVPLDGDGFASWLTKQDKVKAGMLTPEMQRKYAKTKFALLSWKSSRVTGTMMPSGSRTVATSINRDVNFLTGCWVLLYGQL